MARLSRSKSSGRHCASMPVCLPSCVVVTTGSPAGLIWWKDEPRFVTLKRADGRLEPNIWWVKGEKEMKEMPAETHPLTALCLSRPRAIRLPPTQANSNLPVPLLAPCNGGVSP